ncbi:sulfotransferase 2B1-like isoform X3 [Emydura macquarii macquarii]|uniref:sulfotransferase 2B1-like isoform X3 n=1 Tax=Emydura macquarii macquarii TaxID=1129001 RepID=UPI00352AD19F
MAGTNWMLEILSLIRCEGDPGWVRSVPNWERAPWVEHKVGLEAALKYPPPRLLCSHLPVQLFPKSLQRSEAKIIYTLRCPKDVLVSLYHFSHILRFVKDPGSLDSFLEDFLSGNVTYGSWFDHVIGWMGLKDNKNFFSITYEELQQVSPPGPAGQRAENLPLPGEGAERGASGGGGGERLLPEHEGEQDVQLLAAVRQVHRPRERAVPEERDLRRLAEPSLGDAEPTIRHRLPGTDAASGHDLPLGLTVPQALHVHPQYTSPVPSHVLLCLL